MILAIVQGAIDNVVGALRIGATDTVLADVVLDN
jgi:hypothetical protein